jgi:hypothetical protein
VLTADLVQSTPLDGELAAADPPVPIVSAGTGNDVKFEYAPH